MIFFFSFTVREQTFFKNQVPSSKTSPKGVRYKVEGTGEIRAHSKYVNYFTVLNMTAEERNFS